MLLQIIPILPCIGSNEAEQRSKGPCEISIMPGGKQGKTDKCVCCLQVTDLLAIASAGGRGDFFVSFSSIANRMILSVLKQVKVNSE